MGRSAPDLAVVKSVGLGATVIAAVGISLVAASGLDGLLGGFLAVLMIAVAVVDADRYIIPNPMIAAALALALLRAALTGPAPGLEPVLWTMAGAAAAAVPLLALLLAYRRWRGRDGLGPGDVKLAAVAGAWLGWATLFAVIELATLSALGAYFVNTYVRERQRKSTDFLPFGAFLAPAIWIGWLVENWLG